EAIGGIGGGLNRLIASPPRRGRGWRGGGRTELSSAWAGGGISTFRSDPVHPPPTPTLRSSRGKGGQSPAGAPGYRKPPRRRTSSHPAAVNAARVAKASAEVTGSSRRKSANRV